MIFDEENFPVLPDTWVSIPVEEACENISVKDKVQTKNYLLTGKLAIVDQGSNLVGGFTDNLSKAVTDDLPVIVFGDHTRAIKYIDFSFAAGADGIKVLRPNRYFEPRLFYRFLQAIKLPDKGYARHFQHLRGARIALPPLNEQKRIADELDALLMRVDTSRERFERVSFILKRFRQSVLAAATSGKLTEDWLEDREDWQTCPLGSVLTDIRYGTAKKCDYEIKDGTPVIRIPNIGNRRIDPSDLKFAHFSDKELETLSLKSGDLLLIRSNGSVELVGKVAVVEPKFEGYLYAGYLLRLRVNTSIVVPQYLSLFLSSPDVRRHIELVARSTSGVNNINSEEVRAIQLKLPNLDEQREIVRRVETLFAYADRLEDGYTAAHTHVQRLTPALLAKAFRGELVPQDPRDEPASVLLDRIRAQKAGATQPTLNSKRKVPVGTILGA